MYRVWKRESPLDAQNAANARRRRCQQYHGHRSPTIHSKACHPGSQIHEKSLEDSASGRETANSVAAHAKKVSGEATSCRSHCTDLPTPSPLPRSHETHQKATRGRMILFQDPLYRNFKIHAVPAVPPHSQSSHKLPRPCNILVASLRRLSVLLLACTVKDSVCSPTLVKPGGRIALGRGADGGIGAKGVLTSMPDASPAGFGSNVGIGHS